MILRQISVSSLHIRFKNCVYHKLQLSYVNINFEEIHSKILQLSCAFYFSFPHKISVSWISVCQLIIRFKWSRHASSNKLCIISNCGKWGKCFLRVRYWLSRSPFHPPLYFPEKWRRATSWDLWTYLPDSLTHFGSKAITSRVWFFRELDTLREVNKFQRIVKLLI